MLPLAVILTGAGIVLVVGLLLFIAFLLGSGRRAQSPTHDL